MAAVLLPVMAPDTVLCTDRHMTLKRSQKLTRITQLALNGRRRSRRTPKTRHINSVNSLISRYRAFIQPFCGAPSRNLKD